MVPKMSGGSNRVKCSELGIKNMAAAETMEPPKINGMRLPNLVQVLSLEAPTMGCTIKPASGAASQNKLKSSILSPMADKMRLVLAFCKE